MARVSLEDSVWVDPRFDLLAKLLEVDRYSAVARCARLWRTCTDHQTDVLSPALVAGSMDHLGAVDALVGSELAEHVDDGVRIRGCTGRIEWLADLRATRQAAGAARAASATRENGRFTSSTSKPPARAGDALADAGETTSTSPANSSAPAPAPALRSKHVDPKTDLLVGKPTAALPAGKSKASQDRAELDHEALDIATRSCKLIHELTGHKYQPTPQVVRAVAARLAEGYVWDDIWKTINHRHFEWSDDPDMAKYVRPSTIFRPSHFDEYRAQAIKSYDEDMAEREEREQLERAARNRTDYVPLFDGAFPNLARPASSGQRRDDPTTDDYYNGGD